MNKNNSWYEYYMENEADEAYKNYYNKRKDIMQEQLVKDYLNQAAAISDNVGEDIAAFTNEVINGIKVIDNQVVFTGKTKESKTYSMKLAELLGRELGRELGKLPGLLFTDNKRRKK